MSLEASDLRELYQNFATRQDINLIQSTLGAILAKLDQVVPKDTHEVVWKNDTEWKRGTEDRIDSLRTSLETVKTNVDTGTVTWAINLAKDVENLKGERIPSRVFMALGWIVPPLVTYLIVHH